MSVRCFLDIDIGDAALHARLTERYTASCRWLAEQGPIYGLPSTPEELADDEQRDLASSSFAATNKDFEPLFDPPFQLRAGRVVVELYGDVPKASENFRCLCTGEKGLGKASKKPLHYKGVKLHRMIKGKIAQGGDVVRGDGSGGDSIYNGKFNDEKAGLARKHDAIGVLSYANSGKNSNTSQFFFTLGPMPSLDGIHVVVGKVVEGLEVLKRIDEEAASADGTPLQDVVIADCGVLA
jgi:peptidylprolyl isomerase